MLTLDHALKLLEDAASTSGEIDRHERGFLRAKLLRPSSLHLSLIIHPITEASLLRFRVENLGSIDLSAAQLKVLRRVNADLVLGRLAIDNDGECYFELNHPCRDEGSEDPAKEVFGRLLDASASTAIAVARVIMEMKLLDARLPQDAIDEILTDTFGAGDDDGDQGEML